MSVLMAIISILMVLLLFLLPGLTLWHKRFCGRNTVENLAVGACFGFTVGTVGLYLLALTGLRLAWMTWGLLALVSLVYWFQRRREIVGIFRLDNDKRWLVVVLGLTVGLRFFPAFLDEYPRGWDPYSHLLLIQEIVVRDGHVFDWTPYEEIPLRYPIGTHLIVAAFSQVTGLSLHMTFNLLLVWSGLLVCFQVYALVSETQCNRELALYTMAVYCLLPIMGSAGYYAWGGMPNLQGVYLMLGAVTVFARRELSGLTLWSLPLFFVAICLLNEHALASTILVFLVLGLVALSRPAERPLAFALLRVSVPAMVAGIAYYWWRSPGKFSFSETGLSAYGEEFYDLTHLTNFVGIIFVLLVIFGGWIGVARKSRIKFHPVLLVVNLTLLGFFVLMEYPGRLLMVWIYDNNFGPLSPGRFLTDAIPALSVAGGVFFLRVRERTGFAVPGILAIIIGLTVFNAELYRSFLEPQIEPNRLAAYKWVRDHTPLDTFVIDEKIHAAFFCRRPTTDTPLGSSELWERAEIRKGLRRIAMSLMMGKVPDIRPTRPLVLILSTERAALVAKLNDLQPGYLTLLWLSPDKDIGILQVDRRLPGPGEPGNAIPMAK